MGTKQAVQAPTRSHLSLKGSSSMVHEFFAYSLQSILYQRELYPAEDFKPVKKYGLQILVSTDDELSEYIARSMAQVQRWLEHGQIDRLVVAIVEKGTGDVRERWQFDVQVTPEDPALVGAEAAAATEGKENIKCVLRSDDTSKLEASADTLPPARSPTSTSAPPASAKPAPAAAAAASAGKGKVKTDADVRAEIAAIIKQITASCTFLPLLDEECEQSPFPPARCFPALSCSRGCE